ncbi:MAG: hypothetical protein MZV70_41550 [Desulfobacterales bacterium]|nr:hypothetical protein [Desulfobacterales bacterium]
MAFFAFGGLKLWGKKGRSPTSRPGSGPSSMRPSSPGTASRHHHGGGHRALDRAGSLLQVGRGLHGPHSLAVVLSMFSCADEAEAMKKQPWFLHVHARGRHGPRGSGRLHRRPRLRHISAIAAVSSPMTISTVFGFINGFDLHLQRLVGRRHAGLHPAHSRASWPS